MASFELRRRDFLKGCCATAAVGALGPGLFFSPAAHAADTDHDTLVHVFLRGGIDGLNLVVPVSGEDRLHYEQARPGLAIAASGAYGALPLTLAGGSATGFGLHPSASGLHELWDEGRLAIVHGCGMQTAVTRSHFDAQLYLDLGTPGTKGAAPANLALGRLGIAAGSNPTRLLLLGGGNTAATTSAEEYLFATPATKGTAPPALTAARVYCIGASNGTVMFVFGGQVTGGSYTNTNEQYLFNASAATKGAAPTNLSANRGIMAALASPIEIRNGMDSS